MKYGCDTNTSTFEALFVKIKDNLYLDISGVMPDTLGDDDYKNSFVSVHSFYKINLSKGSHNRYVSEDKIPRFQESNTTI